MSKAAASERQVRAVETRKRIMRAALREFSRKGFGGTSIRGIARQAKVPDALIHYHFGGKDALWRVIATELYDRMHADNDAAVSAAEPMSKFDEVRVRARALMQHDVSHLEFVAFNSEEQYPSDRQAFLFDKFFGPRFHSALAGIAEAQERDELPDGDPRLLYLIIVTLASALVQRGGLIEHIMQRPISDPTLQQEYWALVEKLLFRRHGRGDGDAQI